MLNRCGRPRWQRQETLVEPVDATVCGVLVPEIGWHCQGLLWSYETLLGVSVYQTGAHRMRVQSAAVSTAHDSLVAFPVEEDLVWLGAVGLRGSS
jgi:hypothetical protein